MLLSKKIEWIKLVFIVLGILVFMGLDVSRIKEMQWAAGIFIGLLGIFFVTIILSDVIKRINKFSKEIQKEFDGQIQKSISNEQNEKIYSKRIQILNEREILYQQASQTSSKQLYLSMRNAFIALVLSILISLLPVFHIKTVEHFHLIYFSLIIGIYYTCKIALIFLEIVKVGIKLPEKK